MKTTYSVIPELAASVMQNAAIVIGHRPRGTAPELFSAMTPSDTGGHLRMPLID